MYRKCSQVTMICLQLLCPRLDSMSWRVASGPSIHGQDRPQNAAVIPKFLRSPQWWFCSFPRSTTCPYSVETPWSTGAPELEVTSSRTLLYLPADDKATVGLYLTATWCTHVLLITHISRILITSSTCLCSQLFPIVLQKKWQMIADR